MCCIQKTEIKHGCEETINYYRLICLKANQQDYGNGHVRHKSLELYIYKFWGEEDRILIF